ncbi:polyamine-modulated factor 1, partial [Rhinoderma darwinii]|uniref:polyamine-modulated factor 1 n=1 Tax=Rhinoderma darwinii TaxID=43563 RepID=UPI003F668C9E
HSSINGEIQELKDEGNLESLLDTLDKLESEAGNTDLQWRPSGIPEDDVRSHLVPYLLQQREYVRRLVKEKRQENARLAQSVLAGRETIDRMRKEIERRQQTWQILIAPACPIPAAQKLSSLDENLLILPEETDEATSII